MKCSNCTSTSVSFRLRFDNVLYTAYRSSALQCETSVVSLIVVCVTRRTRITVSTRVQLTVIADQQLRRAPVTDFCTFTHVLLNQSARFY